MNLPKLSTLLIISLLGSLLSVQPQESFTCNHDDQEYTEVTEDVNEEFLPLQTRILQSSADATYYPNLRIYTYFDFLDTVTPVFKDYLQYDLVPPIVSLLQAAFRIKYPISGPMIVTQKTLCGKPTPTILNTTGVDADFFLFFTSTYQLGTTWVASTSNCLVSSKIKRPLVANIYLNTYSIGPVDTETNPLGHEFNMYVLLHEALHGIGFSQNFFNNYVDDLGNTLKSHIKSVDLNGSKRTVLDLPILTDRLRKYYGCPTLEGAFLENKGGTGTAGTHWERKFFPFDLLSSGAIHGRKLTEFTLAFMEGTGWYVANYIMAEPFSFGQGQGCDFIYKACETSKSNFEEFCTGTDRDCSQEGRSGGYCKSDIGTDGCKFYTPQVQFDCDNPAGIYYTAFPTKQVYGRGAGSKCFSGNLTTGSKSVSKTTYCFTYNCLNQGVNTVLEVFFGTTKLNCTEEGPLLVPGYKGQINCPDPLQFCNTIGKPYCPRGCSGRGKCIDSKCVCNRGFKGIDCAIRL